MTILEKVQALRERPTVAEVAKALEIKRENLRVGLQRGKYPFGTAIQMGKKGRYTYSIFKDLLLKWVNGDFVRQGQE